MKKFTFLVVVLGAVSLSNVSYAIINWEYCDDCAECTSDLQTNDYVMLTANISNANVSAPGCIVISELEDKVFSCHYGFGPKTIDGINESGDISGIYIEKSDNITIEDCILTDWGVDTSYPFTDAAIFMEKSHDSYIQDNVIANSSNGIVLTGHARESCTYNYIGGNTISYIDGWAGIAVVDYSNHNTISLNSISDAEVGIMPCQDAFDTAIWANNPIEDNDIGICLCSNAKSVTIYYNEIHNNTYDIYVYTSAGEFNHGDYNDCEETYRWTDDSAESGCYY